MLAVLSLCATPAFAQDSDSGFDIFEQGEGGKKPDPPKADPPPDHDPGFDLFETPPGSGPPTPPPDPRPPTGSDPTSTAPDKTSSPGFVGETFTLVHNLRIIAGALDNYDYPPFFAGNPNDALTNLSWRIGFEDKPTDNFAYKLHGEQRVFATTASGGIGGGALSGGGTGDTRYRSADMVWRQVEESDLNASLVLDWFAVTLSFKADDVPIDIIIGRQAITFGTAYIWNPLDEFLPYDPRQIDQTYKPGVDAIRVDVTLGRASGVSIVAAAGRTVGNTGAWSNRHFIDADWYGSAIMARVFFQIDSTGFALQGGKVYGGYQIGGSIVGEIDPLQIYGEAAYLFADGQSPQFAAPLTGDLSQSHFEAVVGFNWPISSDATLTVEYLFNGAADVNSFEKSIARVGAGWAYHLSRHVAAVSVAWTVNGQISQSFLAIVSPLDPSVQLQAATTVTLGDNVSFLAGLQINIGDAPTVADGIRSEFGTFPHLFFVHIEVNF
ncbi:MAG: hypothetical protein AB7S36_06240 [Planctomycetota bacterium]